MPGSPGDSDTRTRILRATLELAGTEGTASVTNRNVARAAEVSLGSLTYHFESQTQLLREALELFLDEELERLEGLAAGIAEAELTSEEAIAALEVMLTQAPERRLAKLELYLQASRDRELRPAAVRCFEAYDRLSVTAAAAMGIGDPDVAPLFVALIDGFQLRRLATGEAELAVRGPIAKLLDALRQR